VVDDLVTEWLIARDLKRLLNGRLVYVALDGKVRLTKKLPPAQLNALLTDPALPQKIKPAAAHVLNLLPFDRALALYRATEAA